MTANNKNMLQNKRERLTMITITTGATNAQMRPALMEIQHLLVAERNL